MTGTRTLTAPDRTIEHVEPVQQASPGHRRTGLVRRVLRESGTAPSALVKPAAYGLIAQASAIALMALSGWLLSRAAEHPPVLLLMTAIVGVRFFGLARAAFRYTERLAGHDVALRAQTRLRLRIYRRLADSSPLRRGGDLLSRMTADVDAVQDLIVRVVVPTAAAALVITATSTAIMIISVPAGLLLLLGSVLSGVLLPVASARLTDRADRSRAPLRAVLADEISEISRARLDLLAYGQQRQAVDRLSAADAALAAAERRSSTVSAAVAALQWLITGAVIIGGLLIGATAVADQRLPPVFLAVLALTPLAMHEVVAALPATAQALTRSRSALRRVLELLELSAAPINRDTVLNRDTGQDPDRVLSAVDLAVGWPGGPTVVSGLDLELRRGERVALVGPSGVGKSTVASAVVGQIGHHGGSLQVAGRIGYLAQDAHVFDTTVAENVRIGARDADDQQVRAALRAVDLDLPLDRLVGEHAGAISGGEARRLALARLAVSSLVDGEQDLLILDEPTEHLDQRTADQVCELIWRIAGSAAVLVLTHDQRLIDRCDRAVPLYRT